MKRTVSTLACVLATALLADRAAAQCPFMVQFTAYGSGCNQSYAPTTPSLTGSFDASYCSVTFTLTAQPMCCNYYIFNRWLIVGVQQAMIPFPGGCDLLATPDVIVVLPASGDLTFLLPPDPGLVGLTAYGQGIIRRFDTISFVSDFDFSAGLQISIL